MNFLQDDERQALAANFSLIKGTVLMCLRPDVQGPKKENKAAYQLSAPQKQSRSLLCISLFI